ncbi:hypothetical protein CROQUDRAFT_95158 [Cronartium quercuum f. sp. fusiforme G11]|uniref:Uncharacterized protein n=1 Tax=Cronartium quercuum f. sp. fusiforme G11 TaxID=708437 RepID=A0A9P6NIP4_9BASI|nr:hypothetical protein CROQUDRAFT_95158 [Cronartium quercuum f. sp. fusiforme G11]
MLLAQLDQPCHEQAPRRVLKPLLTAPRLSNTQNLSVGLEGPTDLGADALLVLPGHAPRLQADFHYLFVCVCVCETPSQNRNPKMIQDALGLALNAEQLVVAVC